MADKNTKPSPKEEYQKIRLPLRTEVGSNPMGSEAEQSETITSGSAAKKESK